MKRGAATITVIAAALGAACSSLAGEAKIVAELNAVQGKATDIGGYYLPDSAKTSAVMRPSATFNEALAAL